METLTQCEYEVAHEIAKGHTPSEIADLLRKSIWTIKAQIRDIHKKLGINNNVELTLFLLCDQARINFDLNEIRKHGISLFFSVWFLILALTPDYQMDMRRFRVRSNVRSSVRLSRNKPEGDLMIFA